MTCLTERLCFLARNGEALFHSAAEPKELVIIKGAQIAAEFGFILTYKWHELKELFFLFALLDTVQKASMGSLNSGTRWLICQCSTNLHQSREFILFILVNHLMTTPGSV